MEIEAGRKFRLSCLLGAAIAIGAFMLTTIEAPKAEPQGWGVRPAHLLYVQPQEPVYELRVDALARDGKAPPPPTATPTPLPAWVTAAGDPVHTLNERQLNAVLRAAGWPEELLAEARIIARCESGWRPAVEGDGGKAKGLFQIHWYPAGWGGWFAAARAAGYVGADDLRRWADPVVNARVALYIYNYEQERGYARWANWTCRRHLG